MTGMRDPLPIFASLALITLLLPTVGATYLQVEGPISSGQLPNNASIYLGKVGPGESFYVLASATTTNQSGAVVNIGWDRLEAVNLPGSAWQQEPSLLYADPMKLKITVPSYASNGTYEFGIRAVNVGNYSKLGNLTINAYVNVTPDVFTSSVTPTEIVAGVGSPSTSTS